MPAALLGLTAFASPPDGGVTFTLSPDNVPLAPGQTITLNVAGNPGDYVMFMIDMAAGPSTVPFLGGIDIGLPQTSAFKTLFSRIGSDGTRSISCTVDCDDALLLGRDFYLQAATYNPETKQICVSDVLYTRWDDDGSCCGPCLGKVSLLMLQYDGPTGVVRVEGKNQAAGIIFEGVVATGETITLLGMDNKGTLGVEIDVFVDDELHTRIHTSCSQPIGPGMVFGDFTVLYGESREGGPLCPPAPAKRARR